MNLSVTRLPRAGSHVPIAANKHCLQSVVVVHLWDEREIGYSYVASWTVKRKLLQLQRTLPEGNEIQYVHKIGNVIFCHGGLRDNFVRRTVKSSLYHNVDAVVEAINGLRHDMMWNIASPIWHRPQLWEGRMYKPRKILQVVGHTPVDRISRNGNVISCDTFSTHMDGRPIGPREFLLINTETWEYSGIAADEI